MKRKFLLMLLVMGGFVCASPRAWSQRSFVPPEMSTEMRSVESQTWHIFGRVETLEGEPVRNAAVRVDVGSMLGGVKTVDTDFQGKFRTEFKLNAEQYPQLTAKLAVTKEGFHDALEMVDFGKGQTHEVDLVMLPAVQDPDEWSQSDLISTIAPLVRVAAANKLAKTKERKDFARGAELFADEGDAVKALPMLTKVAERQQDCAECKVYLGLAELSAGGYSTATQEFAEAAKLSSDKKETASQFIIFGALESWKNQDKRAAGFYLQALGEDPKNAIALREVGRTQMDLGNWESADDYLERAIQAGAPPDARLMRTRVLLEEGDTDSAKQELDTYLGGRPVKDLPFEVRKVYSDLSDRVELQSYARVKSVVSQRLPELVKAIPELKNVSPADPATSAAQLSGILQKVGQNVAALFHNFPDTISVEDVRQETLGRRGKVENSLDQKFQYLLLAQTEKIGLGLQEYRTDSSGAPTAPHGLEGGFMITAGFASDALILHPDYQSGSDFRYLGRETLDGHLTEVVAFAERPNLAKMIERFNDGKTSVLILVQGVAWIDSTTDQIIRIRTDLLKPQSQVRLTQQTTEINYSAVQFKGLNSSLWLPHEVVVTVEWKGKTFRNSHQYSDFKLYKVGSEEKRKTAEAVPSPLPASD